MPKLAFSRHGLSERNTLNQFTGRADVDLAPEDVEEAKEGGRKVKEVGIEFDVAYTSVLTRAVKTCDHLLKYSDQSWAPQIKSWRLNERHYGKLQGLNRKETIERYGDEQAHIWRRFYSTPPLLMEATDEGSVANDRRYIMLDQRGTPGGENLKATLERALPFWQGEIAPALKDDKTVLIAAHGDSLRALAKHTGGISDEDIMDLKIPTSKPLIYELNDDLAMKEKYYL